MAKLKGITLEINGETTGLDKALQGVNKESNKLQSELRQVERLLKLDPGNTELVAQKQRILAQQVDTTKDKLEQLKQAQEQVNRQFANGEISEQQYREFQREIIATEQRLNTLEQQVRENSNSFKNLGESLGKTGEKMKSVGSNLALTVTAPIVGLGVAATKAGMDFEAGMDKVSALSGATGDDLKMLEDVAKEMGSTTKYSATEASDALSFMALAGWDAEQMAVGLEPTLKLAGAAGMELAETADIVTDTLSMFGMEASEAAKMTDILAYTQANSNTDVLQLGEALKYCGAGANAMGYDLEDTAAILGAFADQGLKGSSAGTTLNSMFSDMKKKAKDGAIAIGESKVAIVDAQGNYRDFNDILTDVVGATEGMTVAERDMALASVWGTEALKGVNMALQAGVPSINEFEQGIRGADGTATALYDTMNDNLKGSISGLMSAIEGLAIQLFQRMEPALQKMVDGCQKVVEWFSNMSPATQTLVLVIGALVAAIGPLLIVFGVIATSISAIIAVLPVLGAAFAALTGPIGIAIAAITAAIAIGVAIMKNWDEIKAKCLEVFNSVKAAIKSTWDSVVKNTKAFISTMLSSMGTFLNNLVTSIRNFVPNMLQVGKDLFNGMWDGMKAIWDNLSSWVSEKSSWLLDKLMFWRDSQREMNSGGSDGSHRTGLRSVPFDGYRAILHKGERVLTEAENYRYTEGMATNRSGSITVNQAIYSPTENPAEQQRRAAREFKRLALGV